MTNDELKELVDKGCFMGKPMNCKLEETHISWVMLCGKYAFKIKKPLKLSFLDYSTLQLRKKHCYKELKLNLRFSSIYLDVLPIRFHNDRWVLGGEKGVVKDYAVAMRKMSSAKKMDVLLSKNKVAVEEVRTLAGSVARFHMKAEIIRQPFQSVIAQETFNDLISIREIVEKGLGKEYGDIIPASMQWSDEFLDQHGCRIQQRIDEGFMRDIHGDLHSGNIFLYKKPVIFDCIEFNDRFRQIDILYEIAFMCMDLEAFGQRDLSEEFLKAYDLILPCFPTKEDKRIFIYFKALRANVRAKVHALSSSQSVDAQPKTRHLFKARRYLQLIKAYQKEALSLV